MDISEIKTTALKLLENKSSLSNMILNNHEFFKCSAEFTGMKIPDSKNELAVFLNEVLNKINNDTVIETANSLLYYSLRNAFISNDFKGSNDDIYTANLSSNSKKLKAIAEIKPSMNLSEEELVHWKQIMMENVMAMDDLTADTLDILTAVWLERSKSPTDMVTLTVDDFLRLRGLSEKKNGKGCRGGFEEEQRAVIMRQMHILDNTWVKVHEMDVPELVGSKVKLTKWRGESKAVFISYRFGKENRKGEVTPYVWKARPGDVFANFMFGPGRQTALLSQKALEYDPYRYKYEKRLARYFAWQWRNRQNQGSYMQPFSVSTLLEVCKDGIDISHPQRTKDRLEKALDKLQADNVIRLWQYSNATEDTLPRKGWLNDWLSWMIFVEPPETILDKYQKIRAKPINKDDSESSEDIGLLLRNLRKKKNLTLLEASEEIGISVSRLSRIERGSTSKKNTLLNIKKWIFENR